MPHRLSSYRALVLYQRKTRAPGLSSANTSRAVPSSTPSAEISPTMPGSGGFDIGCTNGTRTSLMVATIHRDRDSQHVLLRAAGFPVSHDSALAHLRRSVPGCGPDTARTAESPVRASRYLA